ncbi:MAG: proprotein convertase P-domain-containing protein [Phycisphaerae bacterium]|nr:proprotein convertase P-domain-containing protein [Phycisphaerae bacterium]
MFVLKRWIVAVVLSALLLAAGADCEVITFARQFDNHNIPDIKDQANCAVIQIDQSHIIHDIDVAIKLTHSNIGDLQIYLDSPFGKSVRLFMFDYLLISEGGYEQMDVIFDDQAQSFIEPSGNDITGIYKPSQGCQLSDFNGYDVEGTWQLRIYDCLYYNSGQLEYLAITITNPEPASIFLLAAGTIILFRNNPRKKLNRI